MSPFAAGMIRALAEALPLPGPVVQYGSYLGRNPVEAPNLRPLFAGRIFLGVDDRPGRGVDLVAHAEVLPIADRTVGSFIALDGLQRIGRFWVFFDHIRRMLRPDGVAILGAPFHSRLHPAPCDYWRFAPDALDLLLQDYRQRLVGWQGDARRPLYAWAAAFGPAYPLLSEAQIVHLRGCLRLESREPLPWLTRLRSSLARSLGGKRAVDPRMLRNRWSVEYRGPDTASALAA
jgi:hypothetical protein